MKYNLSREFRFFRHFKSSLNPVVLGLGRFFLTICPKGMRSSKNLDIEKVNIKTTDDKTIKSYVIKPKLDKEKLPVIFYFHGGAFTFKAAPYHYKYAKQYAKEVGAAVVFVDYRLSHCSPFNSPFNDCFCAYRYFIERADEFGFDLSKIAVAGDSAGGYLATMVCSKEHKENLPMPKCQMLIYPVVDSRCNTKSMEEYDDTPFWNSKLNHKMWKIYQKGGVAENILEQEDLSFLPISYVETAEFDCLKDEGKMLFDRLKLDGRAHVLNETKQTMHGYDIFTKSEITKKSVAARIDFLRKNLK